MTRTFDRIPVFDERSRDFPIRAMLRNPRPRSAFWPCTAHLDQGREGACVGFGLAHNLACLPDPSPVTACFARERIYWPAQRIDAYPGGSYPGARPTMHGTSLLAGLKVLKSIGACSGYRWAFGLGDLVYGMQTGPAVLGLTWYEGMLVPDAAGVIHPTGAAIGGHCILCHGVQWKAGRLILRNSWGPSWGDHGDCYLPFAHARKLLDESGEAAFLIDREFLDIPNLPPDKHTMSRSPWWTRLWPWRTRAHQGTTP